MLAAFSCFVFFLFFFCFPSFLAWPFFCWFFWVCLQARASVEPVFRHVSRRIHWRQRSTKTKHHKIMATFPPAKNTNSENSENSENPIPLALLLLIAQNQLAKTAGCCSPMLQCTVLMLTVVSQTMCCRSCTVVDTTGSALKPPAQRSYALLCPERLSKRHKELFLKHNDIIKSSKTHHSFPLCACVAIVVFVDSVSAARQQCPQCVCLCVCVCVCVCVCACCVCLCVCVLCVSVCVCVLCV